MLVKRGVGCRCAELEGMPLGVKGVDVTVPAVRRHLWPHCAWMSETDSMAATCVGVQYECVSDIRGGECPTVRGDRNSPEHAQDKKSSPIGNSHHEPHAEQAWSLLGVAMFASSTPARRPQACERCWKRKQKVQTAPRRIIRWRWLIVLVRPAAARLHGLLRGRFAVHFTTVSSRTFERGQ
jgi:hypothetical protein